jgi:hypothetical protein
MRQFFRYYGSKFRTIRRYPGPVHDTVIEPCAGSAAYCTTHEPRNVILIEKNPKIAELWRYLIAATPEEIRALPAKFDGPVSRLDVPDGAKHLIGMWCSTASTGPRQTLTRAARRYPAYYWCAHTRDRIASQVDRIKNWRVIQGEYHTAPDVEATWFIDPPYSNAAGALYPACIRDFSQLGTFCQSRKGQVIVCEGPQARWLPFRPLGTARSFGGACKAEMVWTNSTDRGGAATLAVGGGGT